MVVTRYGHDGATTDKEFVIMNFLSNEIDVCITGLLLTKHASTQGRVVTTPPPSSDVEDKNGSLIN